MSGATDTLVKDRRKHPRHTVMLPALLDQFPVTVTDISLSGLGSGNFEMMIDGELGPSRGERASLRFLHDDDFAESIEVEVVRVSNQRGTLGARYVGLSQAERRFIETLLKGQE